MEDMIDKEKCVQFHQWVQRQHYTGFPKVKLFYTDEERYKSTAPPPIERDMTIDELYDYYDKLPDIQKKTTFID